MASVLSLLLNPSSRSADICSLEFLSKDGRLRLSSETEARCDRNYDQTASTRLSYNSTLRIPIDLDICSHKKMNTYESVLVLMGH